jgi:hypothetical protein
MSGTEPLHLHVEIDPGVSPVSGRVTVGGDERPFTGWTELFAALQATVTDDQIGRDGSGSATAED